VIFAPEAPHATSFTLVVNKGSVYDLCRFVPSQGIRTKLHAFWAHLLTPQCGISKSSIQIQGAFMKTERFVRVPIRVCPAVVRSGVAAFLILFVTTIAWSQQSASTQLSKAALAALRTPPQVVTGAATVVGHYTANPKLRLTIALRPPNPEQEATFLREVQDKTSPQYHQFLSQTNWIARFSPTEADEQAVIDWATSQGFTVTHRFPNRLLVDVEAPVSAIETALA